MDIQDKAKKAAILKLMHGYPSSQSKITEEVLEAYLSAVETCSADAVSRSCMQFLSGKVDGHNNGFLPTAAELASNAAQWDYAIATVTASREMRKFERIVPYKIGEKPAPPLEPLGPTKIEINGMNTDISNLTHEEKEIAIREGRLPDESEHVRIAPHR